MYIPTIILVSTWLRGRGGWGDEENVVDIYLYGYNIHNGVYIRVDSALHVIVQENMYLGFLYKTSIIGSIYMRHSSKYNVIVSEAPRKPQGGGG